MNDCRIVVKGFWEVRNLPVPEGRNKHTSGSTPWRTREGTIKASHPIREGAPQAPSDSGDMKHRAS